jgi:hypothetical protein
MNITDHFEKYLGRFESGWGDKSCRIQVVQFKQQPFDGAITYATIGMSHIILPFSESKSIRHELLFSAHESFSSEDIASFLLSFSEFVLSKSQALWRGDVVGPSTPIIDGVAMNAVYASIPVIFDRNLAVFSESDLVPPIVLVWILPIFEQEAKFVKSNGWEMFESILEEINPDLLDLNRPCVIQ